MAKPRVRWECPNGKHPAVLGSTRPSPDSTVRYCLPCSQEAGKLVKRTAPALERKRAERAVARTAALERKRTVERERAQRARLVPVIDFDGSTVELDAVQLLADAWRTAELREQRATSYRHPGRVPPPKLTIRRGSEGKVRGASTREERAGDHISGHAKVGRDEIVLTVAPGLRREWLEAIVVHEAAHMACPAREAHKPRWRSAYLRAVRELYGVNGPLLDGQAAWRLDAQIAAALRARAKTT